MLTFPDFDALEELHQSLDSVVYRTRRQSDQLPVILKVLKAPYPPPRKIARFRREFEINQHLADTTVARAYSLDQQQNRWVMVLEDFGGDSLKRLGFRGGQDIRGFLRVAIAITTSLNEIHQRHVIHKDINPSNILLNPTTNQIKIIDLGIAAYNSREVSSFTSPKRLEGTLAYIAPEQTGRMNRVLDYRADLYSLGVTFYELLTGQLPFVTDDPLELVHYHIARQPTPLEALVPSIPAQLSAIVLKLMAKNAEDRYQTARGLLADLEECLRQLESQQTIGPFELAQHDTSDHFQLPQKLYGRQAEIGQLLAAFDRIANGRTEVVLIAGQSGIGKSALVQELYKPITLHSGYFVAGKFDQLQRDVPYSAFLQAFQALISQLLAEDEAVVQRWREALLAALGRNAQVVIDVLPELELITGPQPAVPELSPVERQNRFSLAFQSLINVFTTPEHPLVMFLDDVQWADGASLKLIEWLLTASDNGYLLMIAAYRDQEVDASHPFMVTLEALRQAKITLDRIDLGPLALPDVAELIADALHTTADEVMPLATVLLGKTGGNPFFIGEFLKTLESQNVISFDHAAGRWKWDLDHVQRQQMTSNIVELLSSNIQKLGTETQQVLSLAACIGHQFDLATLAVVHQQTASVTARALQPALDNELILPLTENYSLLDLDLDGLPDEVTVRYQFAHDRIQQAAYSLIPEPERQHVHQQIGRLLLDNLADDEREQRVFEIVNHLNVSREQLEQETDRLTLAEMNLAAGRKAKSSTAYDTALKHLQMGLDLLSAEAWDQHYTLTHDLYEEAAEAAFLQSEFEEMERLAELLLARAHKLQDKIKVYELRIQTSYARMQFVEAVAIAREVLGLLGVHLPENPTPEDMMQGLQTTQVLLADKSTDDLLALPVMTDPHAIAALRIMNKVFTAAYVAQGLLVPLMTFKQIELTLKHGSTADSAIMYATYALLINNMTGDFSAAERYANLGLALADKLDARAARPRIITVLFASIWHLQRPLYEMAIVAQDGYAQALEVGDVEYAANYLSAIGSMGFFGGSELPTLARAMAGHNEALRRFKQHTILQFQEIPWQATLNLLGEAPDPTRLSGRVYDIDERLPLHRQANDQSSMSVLFSSTLMLCVIFQAPEQAWTAAEELKAIFNAPGSALSHVILLFDSLARLALYDSKPDDQASILEQVATNQQTLSGWAQLSEANFQHKFDLVEAEKARVLGQDAAAREHYDRAIMSAQKHGFVREEALAHELAGRFYLNRGQRELAAHYLRNAHYAYVRWGARAKVEDMVRRYPQFINRELSGYLQSTLTSSMTSTGDVSFNMLDMISVLRSSQALSGHIVLDQLLVQLMKIVIENAGAETGYLILDRNGELVIEAEGSINKAEITALQAIPIAKLVNQQPVLPVGVINYVARSKQGVVLNDAARNGQFVNEPYIVANRPKSLLCTPLINQGKMTGVLYLENNLITGAFTPDRIEILNFLSSQAAISIENAQLYSNITAINTAYERFVPRQFLGFLGKKSITEVMLGDQVQKEMTVLFSDIRDFTSISEEMTPEQNFQFVNEYLSRMEPVINGQHGFIDKYIGDGIMALFPTNPDDALQGALAMLRNLADFNQAQSVLKRPAIRIGIGLHTGQLMMGTVGGHQRMDGTVISDAVNLASRVEGLTKLYGISCLITDQVVKRLSNPQQYHLRQLDRVKVKGKSQASTVYEVFDTDSSEQIALKQATLESFNRAVAHYRDQQFAEAEQVFGQVLAQNPEDQVAQFYLARCAQIREYGVPNAWEEGEIILHK